MNGEMGNNNDGWNDCPGAYGYGILNDNCVRMLSFASSNSLVCANSQFRHRTCHKLTFFSCDGHTKKQIDHFLVHRSYRSIVNDVHVYTRADIQSDHKLVVAHIKLHLRVRRSQWRSPPLDLSCLNVEQKNIAFNVSVHNRFSALADSEGISNSNKLWDNLKASLNGATHQVCPVLHRNNRPWISDTTLRLVEQRRATHSHPLRSGLAHRIKRSLKDDEQAWLTNHADDMQQAADQSDYRTMYANIRLLTGRGRSAPPTTILDQNGLVIKSNELQTQYWAE